MKFALLLLVFSSVAMGAGYSPATDQARFVSIINQYAKQFSQASNGMQRGAARSARRKALCTTFRSMRIRNWVGTITMLDTTGSGRGVLGVNVGQNITLATSSTDDFGESMTHDTISPRSQLFKTVAAERVGARIIFSGNFERGDDDCFAEQSLTTADAMQQPAFGFKFTQVRSASKPVK